MMGTDHGESILVIFAKKKVNDTFFSSNFICNYYKRKGHIMQDHFKSK